MKSLSTPAIERSSFSPNLSAHLIQWDIDDRHSLSVNGGEKLWRLSGLDPFPERPALARIGPLNAAGKGGCVQPVDRNPLPSLPVLFERFYRHSYRLHLPPIRPRHPLPHRLDRSWFRCAGGNLLPDVP